MSMSIIPLLALLFAGQAQPDAQPAPQPSSGNEARVLEVLERTKITRVTYSLYIWNRITPPGEEAREEWSAEFHSGELHRVETPRDRVIANCRTLTGTAISLETGERIEGPSVARVACGINTNRRFSAVEWLGTIQTRFGAADRLRLIDDELIRQYDVSRDGVLLGTVFAVNRPGEPAVLTASAVAVKGDLPERDMFDVESLSRSVVPDRYRQPPRR